MKLRALVIGEQGKPQIVDLDAASVESGVQSLIARRVVVLECRPKRDLTFQWLASRSLPRGINQVLLVEQLRDLLSAGLSVIEALDALNRTHDGRSSPALESLSDRLRQGDSLSKAIEVDGQFSPLLVSLVRAAELTSDLPRALSRFIEHEKRVEELRHRLTSVAIYPAVLACVGVAVLAFLLTYVMPRFARVFEGISGELPWSARAMVTWAHMLERHGLLIATVGALSIAAVAFIACSRQVRAKAFETLLAWSPLRTRLKVYFLARWYRSTGMLLAGGVPLPEALTLSNCVLPSGMRSAAESVVSDLRNGLSPAASFSRAGMVTPVAEKLIQASERAGDLGGALTRIADFSDLEVGRALEKALRTVEPVIMVLIGVGVGGIVVLMYTPIFELASAIQ